jgi:hypothetical protein
VRLCLAIGAYVNEVYGRASSTQDKRISSYIGKFLRERKISLYNQSVALGFDLTGFQPEQTISLINRVTIIIPFFLNLFMVLK